jgi:hypothetical protein
VLRHDTAYKMASMDVAGFGLAMIDQPGLRSISVLITPPIREVPTAKQLVVVGHDTPTRDDAVDPAGFGLGTVVNPAPIERSTSVLLTAPSR